MKKIVLKFGGSIITKKDTDIFPEVDNFPLEIEKIKENADEYIRYDVIRRLGKEVKGAMDEGELKAIIVNGAGPFGHSLVRYKKPEEDVRESVRYLNKKLVSELRYCGLNLSTIVPSITCKFTNDNYDISELWGRAEEIMRNGGMISTYGDLLNDYKVISGDDLICMLAENWQADKVISVMDVEGFYNKNPKKYHDAKIIKRIDGLENLNRIEAEYEMTGDDMTGGISEKARKLAKFADTHRIRGQMIGGLVEGNVKAAMLGDESIGTLILPYK